jgi:hypothetical protein
MKKHHIVILTVSILITAGLFIHDTLYDNLGGAPYTLGDMVKDIIFAGSFYTALFYVLISAFYSWYKSERPKISN